MREIIHLNRGWEFVSECSEPFLQGMPVEGTESAELPHSSCPIPLHYFDPEICGKVSGYRRHLTADPAWEGKRIFAVFEGAAHSASVYLNGELLAEHHCGYTAFEVELTEHLRRGEDNLLAVLVDSRESQNIPPFGHVVDYLTYGGLYREARLELREIAHIRDVFVKPKIHPEEGLFRGLASEQEIEECAGALKVRAVLVEEVYLSLPEGEDLSDYELRIQVFGEGKEAEKSFPLVSAPQMKRNLLEGAVSAFRLRIGLMRAKVWDIVSPVLYEMRTELLKKGELIDRFSCRAGFRRAEFTSQGFYLNGRRLKLRGLNRHQCWPYAGYAMPASVQRQDADIMKKELGLNAVRTSHYPQSQHFLDRCDELGLLVFTEIPGWQHIGDEAWQKQALVNTQEMVCQYRNHSSIILWGVRINESRDDDALYQKTNGIAHALDDSRPTGGVRNLKKSSFLEDVYTYNDFSHTGENAGCLRKEKVTSEMSKPYLISEYGGHMYPTKSFDPEERRTSQALRHARVLDAVADSPEICGSFGWCLFDYNTHPDFGSGDGICYHGVLDYFRNPKTAAYVYASQQEETPVLFVSSSMDIGEHPGGVLGDVYLFTNADSVRMYKNDVLVREFSPKDSPFKNLAHPPILIDDYVGDLLDSETDYSPRERRILKDCLNAGARFGIEKIPIPLKAKIAYLFGSRRIEHQDAVRLYGQYVANWGGEATVYRFEAVKDGEIVKTIVREPVRETRLLSKVPSFTLREGASYDVCPVRLSMTDQNGNVLPFYSGTVKARVEGPGRLIGPELITLCGGMGGTWLRTTGETGRVRLLLTDEMDQTQVLEFDVVN